jgi:hypothetical protein
MTYSLFLDVFSGIQGLVTFLLEQGLCHHYLYVSCSIYVSWTHYKAIDGLSSVYVSVNLSLGSGRLTTSNSLNARFSLRETVDDTGPGSIRLTFTSMNSGHVSNDDPEHDLDLYVFNDPFEFTFISVESASDNKIPKARAPPDAIPREQPVV